MAFPAVCKEAGTAAARAGTAGLVVAAPLQGRVAVFGASGFSSNPGASSAARSSELVGEPGANSVWVTPLLGLPLRGRAVAPGGPCQDGSLLLSGEAGRAGSLRGLPLGLVTFAAAAVAVASAAASAGVLHQHPDAKGGLDLRNLLEDKGRASAQPRQTLLTSC